MVLCCVLLLFILLLRFLFWFFFFFFFKQKTAYEMRISDWSSDVCSSDLLLQRFRRFVCDLFQPLSNVFLATGSRHQQQIVPPPTFEEDFCFLVDRKSVV